MFSHLKWVKFTAELCTAQLRLAPLFLSQARWQHLSKSDCLKITAHMVYLHTERGRGPWVKAGMYCNARCEVRCIGVFRAPKTNDNDRSELEWIIQTASEKLNRPYTYIVNKYLIECSSWIDGPPSHTSQHTDRPWGVVKKHWLLRGHWLCSPLPRPLHTAAYIPPPFPGVTAWLRKRKKSNHMWPLELS